MILQTNDHVTFIKSIELTHSPECVSSMNIKKYAYQGEIII